MKTNVSNTYKLCLVTLDGCFDPQIFIKNEPYKLLGVGI